MEQPDCPKASLIEREREREREREIRSQEPSTIFSFITFSNSRSFQILPDTSRMMEDGLCARHTDVWENPCPHGADTLKEGNRQQGVKMLSKLSIQYAGAGEHS